MMKLLCALVPDARDGGLKRERVRVAHRPRLAEVGEERAVGDAEGGVAVERRDGRRSDWRCAVSTRD